MIARYLPGEHARAEWMRIDTAQILKRFFYCERSLIISQAGWLAAIAPFDIKTTLPRFLWEDAMMAHALRERIFELRYPSRLMEVGDDEPLIWLFSESINAPSAEAFVLSLARIFKPALLSAYHDYLGKADELADGPTLRFMRTAVAEKAEQVALLTRFAEQILKHDAELRHEAENWVSALSESFLQMGGLSLQDPSPLNETKTLSGRREYKLAKIPARDERFILCRYYWPDFIDPDFAYGDGVRLQLRSAISHFNEVWAVETAGAILQAFANELPWAFINDAARWTYDEARHTRMGYDRLRQWGFVPEEIPLGSHIYDSASGEDPIVRLGMLHYFETKNIGKKTKRMEAFSSYEDKMSQHDMDFDWADETIHAHYGRRWLDALYEKYPERFLNVSDIGAYCDKLVSRQIAQATDQDRDEISRVAEAMIGKAEKIRG